jgi:threonyl-tRNA synthetase
MAQETTPEQLAAMRHTAAHVLAAASVQLKPETRLGVGPAIDDGFYHDIDVDERYTEADLKKLEKEMRKIQNKNLPITQREVSKDEARELFKDDPFKLELIDEIEGDTVGISDMGDGFFITLCKGGHVESTGEIGAFKLTRLAGVYWKGDAAKQQLQRVYGLLFATEEELKEHQRLLEEAKKRDHRKLGKELDLFTFSPLVGSGLPLFTPRGTIIRQQLENYVRSLQEQRGYQQVHIPHLAKGELYKVSGHWDKFQENLFHVKGSSDEELVIKPMNCPHHTQLYASRPRSYRDLPLRFAETTTIYRDEKPGELLGLARVRSITQDDAHVFAATDQLADEIKIVFDLVQAFYAAFDFKLEPHLSVRNPGTPEKYLGDDALWQQAESYLAEALDNSGMQYTRDEGEAAFYGPKIDFVARDSLQRTWQLATIQLDFNMPTRFKLSYTDVEGKEQTPVMIHRALSGSIERFMAILLEHYAGHLPLWLSPTQVAVLPISDEQAAYAQTVVDSLKQVGIRTELDDRSESIGKKIRNAEQMKIPVMLIVGKKEVEANTVAVRSHAKGDEGAQSLTEVQEKLVQAIQERH